MHRGSLLILLLIALGGCNNATPSPDKPSFTFGETGLGKGEFSYPRAGVWSPKGSLYVVDKSGRIQRFSPDGKFMLDWSMPEFTAGKPTGLGVDRDGRIYAADTHYARVSVFDADGKIVRMFGEWGEGPGQFRLPTDVAVDHDGNIYVSEYGGNDRVSKYTPDFKYLFSFAGKTSDTPTERPQALAIDADNSVWVADSCNHRILHFSPDGKHLGGFGTVGAGVGEMRFPYSVDFLHDGSLVVAEYGNNRIQRFTREGKSLGVWGRAGKRLGELAYPWAAICGPDDRVYAIDSGSNRVQVFAAGDFRKP